MYLARVPAAAPKVVHSQAVHQPVCKFALVQVSSLVARHTDRLRAMQPLVKVGLRQALRFPISDGRCGSHSRR